MVIPRVPASRQDSLASQTSELSLNPSTTSASSTSATTDGSSLLSHRSSGGSSATSYTSVAEHACLTLHGQDRLRLFGLSSETIKRVADCVRSHWPAGLAQDIKQLGDGCVELRASGRIWISACRIGILGRKCPGTNAQVVLVHVLEELAKEGWEVLSVSDVGYTGSEKDSIFLRRSSRASKVCSFFMVQFDAGGDRLRVTKAPNDVVSAFRHIFSKLKHTEAKTEDSLLFKFSGLPLIADGSTEISTRFTFLTILDMIAASGHELAGSIDMSGGGEGGVARTWIIRSVSAGQ